MKLANLLYKVNLDDFLVCWNFHNSGSIFSLSVAQSEAYGNVHPVYTSSLTDIQSGKGVSGFSAPRLAMTQQAFLLNTGVTLYKGNNPLPQSEIDYIHFIADFELKAEQVRRTLRPYAPSRLVCIFAADNSPIGQQMLNKMFNGGGRDYIVNCEAIVNNHVRLDSKWLDEYFKTNDIMALEQYWLGSAVPNSTPHYEFLIEGIIKLVNKSDQDYISANGTLS